MSVGLKKQLVSVIPLKQLSARCEIFLHNAPTKNGLSLPTDCVGENETALQTAKRLITKVIGIEAMQYELLSKIVLTPDGQENLLFLVEDLEIGPLKENVIRLQFKDAVRKVVNGEIFHSPSMTAILLIEKLRFSGRLLV